MSTLLKSQLDWQSREVNARRKGLAEGRNEGFADLPIETIERM